MGDIHPDYLERAICGRPGTPVLVNATAASVRTGAPLSAHQMYTFCCNVGCHIKFGDNTVVATTSDFRMPANIPFVFTPESDLYVAVIRGAPETADGVLQMTPMVT